MKIRFSLFALLLVVAAAPLAKAETQIVVHLEAVNLLGDPISEIPLGTAFELWAFVQDVRDSTPVGGDLFGVFSAYVDVAFDAGKASATGPVVVDDFFDDIPVSTISSTSPGLLQGGGATTSITNPGSAEQLLFTVALQSDNLGDVIFTPTYFGDSFFEWFAYGDFDFVPAEDVQFTGLEVTIVPEPASIVLCVVGTIAVGAVALRRRKTNRISNEE